MFENSGMGRIQVVIQQRMFFFNFLFGLCKNKLFKKKEGVHLSINIQLVTSNLENDV